MQARSVSLQGLVRLTWLAGPGETLQDLVRPCKVLTFLLMMRPRSAPLTSPSSQDFECSECQRLRVAMSYHDKTSSSNGTSSLRLASSERQPLLRSHSRVKAKVPTSHQEDVGNCSSGSVGMTFVMWILGALVAATGTVVYIESGTVRCTTCPRVGTVIDVVMRQL